MQGILGCEDLQPGNKRVKDAQKTLYNWLLVSKTHDTKNSRANSRSFSQSLSRDAVSYVHWTFDVDTKVPFKELDPTIKQHMLNKVSS